MSEGDSGGGGAGPVLALIVIGILALGGLALLGSFFFFGMKSTTSMTAPAAVGTSPTSTPPVTAPPSPTPGGTPSVPVDDGAETKTEAQP